MRIGAWLDLPPPESLDIHVRLGLRWIDNVHPVIDPEDLDRWTDHSGRPRLIPLGRKCVLIEEFFQTAKAIMGKYEPSRVDSDWRTQGPRMTLNPETEDLAGTFVHECWHMIHLEMIH